MAKSSGPIAAISAFLTLPGVVAYGVPLAIGWERLRSLAFVFSGGVLVAVGTVLLLACVVTFYSSGKGTLAPWAPPVRLVTQGPYRLSRNPMYLAVMMILAGWSLIFASLELIGYSLAVGGLFWWRVVYWEEPRASRDFAADWYDYCRRVRRWL